MKNRQSTDKLPKSERLCRLLDIPTGALPFGYSIELQGRSLLKLCGGGRILLYTPEEIRIALLHGRREVLSVKGAGLSCASYNKSSLGIEGMISSISFERMGSYAR